MYNYQHCVTMWFAGVQLVIWGQVGKDPFEVKSADALLWQVKPSEWAN